MSGITGYRRDDGRLGVRNDVLVIPLSAATSPIATRIAAEHGPTVKAAPHEIDPDRSEQTRDRAERVLAGIGRNPNVGAACVLGLGVESIDGDGIADEIHASGTAVETRTVREAGGVRATIDQGTELVERLSRCARDARQESAEASELIVGVECGGSDATSGIAANPALGNACDELVAAGGTVCISETPEFIGAEHVLAERCASDRVRKRLLERVRRREGVADTMGVNLRETQPTPGNEEGGLTTIEEKSLGAIAKCGTTPIERVVDYGEELPRSEGVVVMDTPGYDVESVVGKVAGGAQIIAFTTGRGSTTGNPIAPVLKITGNPATWTRLTDNMDIDASTVFEGESLAAVGERIYESLLEVADSRWTAAERHSMQEFAISDPNTTGTETQEELS